MKSGCVRAKFRSSPVASLTRQQQDIYPNLFRGYIVPHEVFKEAVAIRSNGDTSGWSTLPPHKLLALQTARRMMVERFPHTPAFAVKIMPRTSTPNRQEPLLLIGLQIEWWIM